MRDLFPGHYPISEEEDSKIWSEGLFVFDTNVLLNLYRLKLETAEKLLSILEALKDRVWIPYHVAYEFHRRRLTVVLEQNESYEKIKQFLAKTERSIQSQLPARHPLFDRDPVVEKFAAVFEEVQQQIEDHEKGHPNYLKQDALLERLTRLTEGRVGPRYTVDEFADLEKQGKERYDDEIPPGFMDKEKTENRYGDWIVWRQTLNHLQGKGTPVVFVSDEQKRDWWEIDAKKRKLRPDPRLVEEFSRETGSRLLLLVSSAQFLERAGKLTQVEVSGEDVEEALEAARLRVTVLRHPANVAAIRAHNLSIYARLPQALQLGHLKGSLRIVSRDPSMKFATEEAGFALRDFLRISLAKAADWLESPENQFVGAASRGARDLVHTIQTFMDLVGDLESTPSDRSAASDDVFSAAQTFHRLVKLTPRTPRKTEEVGEDS